MNGSRGFLLVEVVVALLVMSVGLLALAGTAASIARMSGQGRRRSGAALAAAARLETLRAGGCRTLAGGRDSSGPFRLSWTLAVRGTGRVIDLSVEYPDGPSSRRDRFEAVAWCP